MFQRAKFMFFAFTLAGYAGIVSPLAAQQTRPEEYQVKATYLFNFSKFVEWPPTAATNNLFTICVLGRDPFGATLDATLAGEMIGNRKIVARRLAAVQDSTDCQILFISSSEASRTKQILTSVGKSGVLTVSDSPGFAASGGMIQFVLRDNKVRFEVNLTAAENAGMNLSSQLLKVALTVIKDPPGEKVNP